MIFLPSIKGRSQQLAWLIAMRKKLSLASRAVGLLYSYICLINRSLSVESNFPSRSLDCLMHNFIGVNLSITDLIAEALVKVPRQGGAGRIMESANDLWSIPGRHRRDAP